MTAGGWSSRPISRDERGSASVLMAGVMGVVVLLSYTLMLVAGYAVAYHRARAAADLVAVSAAGAFEMGQDACGQARRSATSNGAGLLSCDRVGDQLGFVVTVRVSIRTPSHVAGLPRQVQAEAHAGPVG
ncbi:Rv3654c family TadE-like protein [uncultured Friedmanniella sp.]|uniref:Rv3654c family TadE-like protein n=1 Tax=uncultured Friedmanniella sp. TaxID=335381 RepID=UPI0035CA5B8C